MNDGARELIQQALPAYQVAGELGRGAFGVVYEARHTQLDRPVAIKQLPSALADDESVRERFVAEAQMVASLEHPHIVPVYDFVESDGARYLIMERCAGSVGDRFKTDGIVTDEACAAVLACLSALDFAHQKGLLHRDVKPENLMYDNKGVVKLADFGIARDLGVDTRRTATGMIIGTPAYMSPEQCRGDDLTPASDVYSVGVMAYELLTGVLPFPKTDAVNGLLAHHLVTPPTPLLQSRPELPGSVGEVIDRSLAKDLNVRYGTAVEFATALARACVTAFGSGWLRRRRFVLHWPEIISETERPDSNSPRTGTIIVRAGDLPTTTPIPEDPGETTALAASAPVVSAEGADASTLPYDGSPATAPSTDASPSSGTNWPLIGGVAAAIVALIVGVVAFAGGGSEGSGITVTEPAAVEAEPTAAPSSPTVEQVEPTAVPNQAEPTAAPEPTSPPEPNATSEPVADFETRPGPIPITERDEANEDQPVTIGSNGNPIMTFPPLDFDPALADGAFAPTPCPFEEPLVACIFAIIAPDEDGQISVPYFTLGFTPRLEPIGHHIHFYIPELVDGDETKAGVETPGGAWRQWDGPWPATSFGGDNGRTMYTFADLDLAGSTTICAIVADPENRAIPGSGNCAPVVNSDNFDQFVIMSERIEGRWVGNCGVQAMAIAPDGWRSYDLTTRSPAEVAAEIRPRDTEAMTAQLEAFVANGGVVWAEGPVEGDFIVSFGLSVIPGDFVLSDGPAEVATKLGELGIPAPGGPRTVAGTSRYFEASETGATYVIPDFDHAVAFTLNAPAGAGYNQLADQIAATVSGC